MQWSGKASNLQQVVNTFSKIEFELFWKGLNIVVVEPLNYLPIIIFPWKFQVMYLPHTYVFVGLLTQPVWLTTLTVTVDNRRWCAALRRNSWWLRITAESNCCLGRNVAERHLDQQSQSSLFTEFYGRAAHTYFIYFKMWGLEQRGWYANSKSDQRSDKQVQISK